MPQLDFGLLQPTQRINSPFENLSQIMQLRNQQQAAQALVEDRRAQTAERTQKTEQSRLEQQRDAAITQLYGDAAANGTQVSRADLYKAAGPERGDKILKGILDLQNAQLDNDTKVQTSVRTRLSAIRAFPEQMRGQAWDLAVKDYTTKGIDMSQVPAYSPQALDAFEQAALTPDKQYDVQHPKPTAVPAGTSLAAPDASGQMRTTYTAPAAPSPALREYQDAQAQGFKGSFQQYQDQDANRKRPVTNMTMGGGAGDGLDEGGQELLATQYRLLGAQAIPARISGSDRAKVINIAAAQMKILGQSPAVAIQKQYALKADAGSLNKITTMAATASAFENKAIQQADLVRELSEKVDRTNFPVLNKALLAGNRDLLGDTNTQLLYNALTTFTAEYAKIIEGSTGSAAGSSDAARKASASLASASMKKETLAKTLDLMQKEMRYTIQGYEATTDIITAKMGGRPGVEPVTAPPAAVPAPAAAVPAGIVEMTAPDGRRLHVPAGDVQRMLSLGAKKVGG